MPGSPALNPTSFQLCDSLVCGPLETGGSQTENPAPRTIYIGPEAYGLFTMPYTSAQGMENTANNAPIKLRLIYTMIK